MLEWEEVLTWSRKRPLLLPRRGQGTSAVTATLGTVPVPLSGGPGASDPVVHGQTSSDCREGGAPSVPAFLSGRCCPLAETSGSQVARGQGQVVGRFQLLMLQQRF